MIKELAQQFIRNNLASTISKKTGLDLQSVQTVANEWIWSMLRWLANNTRDTSWASSLFSAINNDHDWSVLEQSQQLLHDEKQNEWMSILWHIFGRKEEAVEETISKDTWVSFGNVKTILSMAAPVLMWFLGRKVQQNWFGIWDLSSLLSREKQEIKQSWWSLQSMLWGLFDQDWDGDLDINDAIKMLT